MCEEILGDALHRLYASKQRKTLMGWIGPEWEQGAVAGLDSAMNNFLDSVPPHLRSDSDNNETGPFSHQSAILYMTYYYVQTTIHRPFVHNATTLAGPSLSICTSAARSALHIADRVWMTRVHELPSFFVQTPVFVSTLILVMSIFGPKRAAGPSVENIKDLARLEKALEILKLSATRSQTAGRQYELIQELQSLEFNLTYSGASSAEQPDVRLAERPPTSIESAGNPTFIVFSGVGVPDKIYPQHPPSFEPGTSIEQLLADVAPSEQENDWMTSSDLGNGIVLDNEVMSMWMAVPTDFSNTVQWNAYIENMNAAGM